MTSTANEDAEDLRTGTNNLDWGEVSRLKMTATRERLGTARLRKSSHLPAMDGSMEVNPVMLPPGCVKFENETLSDWIGHLHEDDRYGYGADRPPVCMTNDIFTLVVDHVGKDKKRGIMGSIAKVANADVVLLLDVNKKNGTVTSSKMILHMMRGGAAGMATC
jgi:hypothetical protein